jgi:ABC-type multidrug transport system ATPase subunit
VRELILKLKQETNKTIILSSHLLSEIELIANRVVILNKGKALVQGEVSELVNASELLVSIQVDNGLKAQEALQQSRFSGHEILLSNQEIQLKTSRQEIPEILGILMDNGISIYAVESKRKLEDYFLKLTSN